ncbi:hypothetical protein ACIRD6_18410 [Streptomyces sp. NPDC102473]|uniref:hypothetical protein n=1 Tax=Streptomyces sp. NPDC102473 TaxID=3366180 RepID=UPI0038215473
MMPTSRYVVQCQPGIREVISGSSPPYGSVVPAPRVGLRHSGHDPRTLLPPFDVVTA